MLGQVKDAEAIEAERALEMPFRLTVILAQFGRLPRRE